MEVLTCSTVQYAENSCHPQKNSIMKIVHDGETNCGECAEQAAREESKGDDFVPNMEVPVDGIEHDEQELDGEAHTLEGSCNRPSHCDFDVNGQKLSDGLVDQEEETLDEHYKEACLDFQNSYVVVNTIDSEPLCESKEEDSSASASNWPEHDESLPLWVKWRGKWQAGIKCERADWPLATVKAKPTHDRKNYVVIFFPHKKNYSWADTLLVCSIDEFPQPIAHRSHKVGVQLVEDLTVARRFIMKKLVIGMLNILDQLPLQVLVETARDVAVWKEFATDASRCKGYPDLGRLLLKLRNMLLQLYIDGNWLQHSFQLWVEKCQNALSAESIELLKEEFVDSILWSEVNSLRDAQGQSALGSDWKMWKHEAMKCFSTRHPAPGVGNVEQPNKNGTGQQSADSPLMRSLHTSRKRPKLEVRRAEQHNSQVEYKSSQDNTIADIDSAFFAGQSTLTDDNANLEASVVELSGQRIAPISSTSNAVDRWDEVAVDTSNAESVQIKELQPGNVGLETKSLASKGKNRQCIAFIEAKGRRCVRWANDGDEYCCVHLTSRFAANSVKTEIILPADTPMCQGTTTAGTRCKHRSLPGSSFCKKHRPRSDAIKSPSSPGSQLKRKHEELLDQSEHTSCKEIVMVGEPEGSFQGHPATENTSTGGNGLSSMCDHFAEKDIPRCIGLGLHESSAHCSESAKRHSLYCEKHIPSWLKRARNGKSRIISKEVFLDLLRGCSSWKQKVHLHQACELFYKLLKSILSLRNPVPKEIQFQWALAEASKDFQVAELLMKLVCREKERLGRIWGLTPNNDAQISSSPMEERAVVPMEEESDYDGAFKCKICSEEFSDDQTLGAHWIDNHNKEAQWLFRGYACAICLDSFTNRKVLEMHVQERHHAQFVEHCMLIQCIPCGSHFGNSDELWSHVLSAHTEGFRQSKTGDISRPAVSSQQKPTPPNPASIENNSEAQGTVRKYICRFCGLRFDLLPDLGRHHQAAHMGPSLLSSRPKKKGLRFYAYRLKSGRLSRPRFKKGLGGASYRLRNKGSIVLKKRIQPMNALGAGRIDVQSHIMSATRLVRLTEAQCSAIAKTLCSEARKTKARPNNHEILSVARSTCCRVSLQNTLELKYGVLPERLYLKAARLCSEHNTQVDWHQEGFNCPRGCKPPEDRILESVLTSLSHECSRLDTTRSDPQQKRWEKDECHYVIDSRHFRQQPLQTTIILCDDISFGQEAVPVSCVVDRNLIDSLHTPTYAFDGRVIFMPWESFTYVTEPHLDRQLDDRMQNLQLGCSCAETNCSPEKCDHVYLFNTDHENAKDINGKSMVGRFPYDDKGLIILEDGCLVYECNHLCKCSRNCPNRVLQNGLQVKLEVFKTEKKGWGVRACEPIFRGTFVCEFVGEVIDMQEANKRHQRYGKTGCNYFYDVGAHMRLMNDLMDGQENYVIDTTKYGNVSRFLNHGCFPNLVSHLVLVESMDFQLAHVGFYAMQDIAAGEELTYDYGDELQPGEGTRCLCGASTCRGRLC